MPRPIEETSPTIFLADASMWPAEKIEQLRRTNKKDCCDLRVRFLHVLQLVTLLAIPIILFTSVLEAAFRAVICQYSEATEALLISPLVLFAHACLFPVTLTGAFTNDDLAQKFGKVISDCLPA